MGGFFSQLHDAFTGGAPDSPTARLRNSFVSTKESQAAQEKQAETDNMQRQQANDLAFHDKMMGLGAKYVHDSGLVQETAPDTGDQEEMGQGPAQPKTFVRQANPDRIVKHTTAEKQQVQYELPTPEDQIKFQGQRALQTQQANLPAAQATAEQAAAAKEAENTAGARGTGLGKSQAETADLAARGRDLDEETAKQYMLPPGRYTPEQINAAAVKANPANIRANASTANANTRAQSVQAVADLKKQQEEEMLAHRDQWEKARNSLGVQRNGIMASRVTGQNAVRGRQLVGDQQLHEKNLTQAYKEDQNALTAQGLIGQEEGSNFFGQKTTTPSVADGEDFNDPFTGKKMTMNSFQRQRLKNAIDLATQRSNDLKASAEQIAKRYGIGQQQSQPAGAAPGQAAAAQPQQQAQPIPPKVGEIRKGYKFKGGNYADQSSWEKVPGQ